MGSITIKNEDGKKILQINGPYLDSIEIGTVITAICKVKEDIDIIRVSGIGFVILDKDKAEPLYQSFANAILQSPYLIYATIESNQQTEIKPLPGIIKILKYHKIIVSLQNKLTQERSKDNPNQNKINEYLLKILILNKLDPRIPQAIEARKQLKLPQPVSESAQQTVSNTSQSEDTVVKIPSDNNNNNSVASKDLNNNNIERIIEKSTLDLAEYGIALAADHNEILELILNSETIVDLKIEFPESEEEPRWFKEFKLRLNKKSIIIDRINQLLGSIYKQNTVFKTKKETVNELIEIFNLQESDQSFHKYTIYFFSQHGNQLENLGISITQTLTAIKKQAAKTITDFDFLKSIYEKLLHFFPAESISKDDAYVKKMRAAEEYLQIGSQNRNFNLSPLVSEDAQNVLANPQKFAFVLLRAASKLLGPKNDNLKQIVLEYTIHTTYLYLKRLFYSSEAKRLQLASSDSNRGTKLEVTKEMLDIFDQAKEAKFYLMRFLVDYSFICGSINPSIYSLEAAEVFSVFIEFQTHLSWFINSISIEINSNRREGLYHSIELITKQSTLLKPMFSIIIKDKELLNILHDIASSYELISLQSSINDLKIYLNKNKQYQSTFESAINIVEDIAQQHDEIEKFCSSLKEETEKLLSNQTTLSSVENSKVFLFYKLFEMQEGAHDLRQKISDATNKINSSNVKIRSTTPRSSSKNFLSFSRLSRSSKNLTTEDHDSDTKKLRENLTQLETKQNQKSNIDEFTFKRSMRDIYNSIISLWKDPKNLQDIYEYSVVTIIQIKIFDYFFLCNNDSPSLKDFLLKVIKFNYQQGLAQLHEMIDEYLISGIDKDNYLEKNKMTKYEFSRFLGQTKSSLFELITIQNTLSAIEGFFKTYSVTDVPSNYFNDFVALQRNVLAILSKARYSGSSQLSDAFTHTIALTLCEMVIGHLPIFIASPSFQLADKALQTQLESLKQQAAIAEIMLDPAITSHQLDEYLSKTRDLSADTISTFLTNAANEKNFLPTRTKINLLSFKIASFIMEFSPEDNKWSANFSGYFDNFKDLLHESLSFLQEIYSNTETSIDDLPIKEFSSSILDLLNHPSKLQVAQNTHVEHKFQIAFIKQQSQILIIALNKPINSIHLQSYLDKIKGILFTQPTESNTSNVAEKFYKLNYEMTNAAISLFGLFENLPAEVLEIIIVATTSYINNIIGSIITSNKDNDNNQANTAEKYIEKLNNAILIKSKLFSILCDIYSPVNAKLIKLSLSSLKQLKITLYNFLISYSFIEYEKKIHLEEQYVILILEEKTWEFLSIENEGYSLKSFLSNVMQAKNLPGLLLAISSINEAEFKTPSLSIFIKSLKSHAKAYIMIRSFSASVSMLPQQGSSGLTSNLDENLIISAVKNLITEKHETLLHLTSIPPNTDSFLYKIAFGTFSDITTYTNPLISIAKASSTAKAEAFVGILSGYSDFLVMQDYIFNIILSNNENSSDKIADFINVIKSSFNSEESSIYKVMYEMTNHAVFKLRFGQNERKEMYKLVVQTSKDYLLLLQTDIKATLLKEAQAEIEANKVTENKTDVKEVATKEDESKAAEAKITSIEVQEPNTTLRKVPASPLKLIVGLFQKNSTSPTKPPTIKEVAAKEVMTIKSNNSNNKKNKHKSAVSPLNTVSRILSQTAEVRKTLMLSLANLYPYSDTAMVNNALSLITEIYKEAELLINSEDIFKFIKRNNEYSAAEAQYDRLLLLHMQTIVFSASIGSTDLQFTDLLSSISQCASMDDVKLLLNQPKYINKENFASSLSTVLDTLNFTAISNEKIFYFSLDLHKYIADIKPYLELSSIPNVLISELENILTNMKTILQEALPFHKIIIKDLINKLMLILNKLNNFISEIIGSELLKDKPNNKKVLEEHRDLVQLKIVYLTRFFSNSRSSDKLIKLMPEVISAASISNIESLVKNFFYTIEENEVEKSLTSQELCDKYKFALILSKIFTEDKAAWEFFAAKTTNYLSYLKRKLINLSNKTASNNNNSSEELSEANILNGINNIQQGLILSIANVTKLKLEQEKCQTITKPLLKLRDELDLFINTYEIQFDAESSSNFEDHLYVIKFMHFAFRFALSNTFYSKNFVQFLLQVSKSNNKPELLNSFNNFKEKTYKSIEGHSYFSSIILELNSLPFLLNFSKSTNLLIKQMGQLLNGSTLTVDALKKLIATWRIEKQNVLALFVGSCPAIDTSLAKETFSIFYRFSDFLAKKLFDIDQKMCDIREYIIQQSDFISKQDIIFEMISAAPVQKTPELTSFMQDVKQSSSLEDIKKAIIDFVPFELIMTEDPSFELPDKDDLKAFLEKYPFSKKLMTLDLQLMDAASQDNEVSHNMAAAN